MLSPWLQHHDGMTLQYVFKSHNPPNHDGTTRQQNQPILRFTSQNVKTPRSHLQREPHISSLGLCFRNRTNPWGSYYDITCWWKTKVFKFKSLASYSPIHMPASYHTKCLFNHRDQTAKPAISGLLVPNGHTRRWSEQPAIIEEGDAIICRISIKI